MNDTTYCHPAAAARPSQTDEIADQLREPLAARAERLGLEPTSIGTVGPGARIARDADGGLLRVDLRAYQLDELAR